MRMQNGKAMITYDLPSPATDMEVAEYITAALECYGGGGHPEDPLFNSLSIKAVRVGSRVYLNTAPKVFKP